MKISRKRKRGEKKESISTERRKKLEKRLLAYSFAVGAVALGAGAAEGTVIYVDIIPDYVFGSPDTYALDVNGDGWTDIFFNRTAFTNTWSIHSGSFVFAYGSSRFRGMYASLGTGGLGIYPTGPNMSQAKAFNYGATISSRAIFGRNNGLMYSYNFWTTNGISFGPYTNGPWLTAPPPGKYLAYQFTDQSLNKLYGWARLSTNGAILYDAAYDDSGAKLWMGETPEPSSLALLALGAVGLAWRRRRRKRKKKTG